MDGDGLGCVQCSTGQVPSIDGTNASVQKDDTIARTVSFSASSWLEARPHSSFSPAFSQKARVELASGISFALPRLWPMQR